MTKRKRRTRSAVSAAAGVTISEPPSTTATTPTADEPLIGPAEVSLLLGVPVTWVYAKSEAGELPSYKLGHYRRFKRTEIVEYLRACRTAPNGR